MGYLRLALAFAVVAFHFGLPGFAWAGPVAVFSFYTVSGYLMTMVLSKRYEGRPGAFILNRALRLYPTYWLFALIGFGAALAGPTANSALVIPVSLNDVWRQVTIFGLLHLDAQTHPVRLVPVAWSLNMELTWYLAMMVLIRFGRLWLGVASIIALYVIARNDFTLGYYSYLGPAFCFAIGSWSYRLGTESKQTVSPVIGAAGLVLAVALGNIMQPMWLLYGASACTALLMFSLRGRKASELEKIIGDLSYPVFLCHWSVASLLQMEIGWRLFVVATPIILLVSALALVCVERPIEKIRSKVRNSASPRTKAA